MTKIKDRRNEERRVYMYVGRPIKNRSNCVSFGTALAFEAEVPLQFELGVCFQTSSKLLKNFTWFG